MAGIPRIQPPLVLLIAGAFALSAAALLFVRTQAPAGEAGPYLPQADSEVLERLAEGGKSPRSRELAALRERLKAEPRNLELAVLLAREYIQESRARSDPRFLGYAQAALAPWWSQEDAPSPVLLLRATVRQSTHDFDRALTDLDRLLEREPRHAQAWLTRAVIQTVRGDYEAALGSCKALAPLVRPLIGTVCRAGVDSLTGNAQGSYAQLAKALAESGTESPLERAWAASVLGEIAGRAGDSSAAERHLREALALDPADTYARGAYADLLLDLGRAYEAVQLLQGQSHNDALLLRLAIAERQMGGPQAPELTRALRERFVESRARGDAVHLREEARFSLVLEQDARRALELARANWQVQREPWDARILLEAALATGEAAAARPVLEALESSRLEDPKLLQLMRSLRETRR